MSGKIAATFQAKEEGISGLVVTDKQETRDLLADQMGFLASAIQESDGEQVDLRFAIEKNLDLNHFSGVASGKSGNVTFVNDSAASTKEAVDKEGQSTEGKKEDSCLLYTSGCAFSCSVFTYKSNDCSLTYIKRYII